MKFDFTMRFLLPEDEADFDTLVERLAAGGCDDATVGTGRPGRIALAFTREAPTATDAMLSAIADVKKAIPRARLIDFACYEKEK